MSKESKYSKDIEAEMIKLVNETLPTPNQTQKQFVVKVLVAAYNKGRSEALSEKEEESKQTPKLFEIDFGGNVLTEIKVDNNEIEVIRAINGYADRIMDYKILVKKLPTPPSNNP